MWREVRVSFVKLSLFAFYPSNIDRTVYITRWQGHHHHQLGFFIRVESRNRDISLCENKFKYERIIGVRGLLPGARDTVGWPHSSSSVEYYQYYQIVSVYYCIYVLIATHACVSSIMTTYEFDGKICVSWMSYYCSNMWSKLASKTHFRPYMD